MAQSKSKIFISYSHQNKEVCNHIAAMMEQSGKLTVWYDKGLIPGEEYRIRIASQIKEADYFIVLLSEKSICSDWVLDEVEYAKKLRKKILPIWIEAVDLPENLDMILQRYHSLFWHLRTSDSQFENMLFSSILPQNQQDEGKSPVGNGNDFSESENRRMRELLEKEAQGCYSLCYEAQNACMLGKAYRYGGPCAADREKAKFYFHIAEYLGDQDAACYLLIMALEDEVENTWDEPEESFSAPIVAKIHAIADAGSIPARLFMGDVYWYGRYGYPVDLVESARMFESCAREGDARGQYMMAANYYCGDGVPKDYVLAQMYANLAIEQQYIKGWRRWGKFYREGLAVPQDYAKARECYEKGAQMGDFNCYNKVGDMLYYGWGYPVNYEEAFGYYLKGEQAPVFMQKYGLRKANEALGRCYEHGHGVEKNLILAAEKYLEGYRYGNEACKEAFIRCRNLSAQE